MSVRRPLNDAEGEDFPAEKRGGVGQLQRVESILDDRELVGERSENFIPSEGKTFDHGEESDVFEFDEDDHSEKGKFK